MNDYVAVYFGIMTLFVMISLTVRKTNHPGEFNRIDFAWVVVVCLGWPLIVVGVPFWAIHTVIRDYRKQKRAQLEARYQAAIRDLHDGDL